MNVTISNSQYQKVKRTMRFLRHVVTLQDVIKLTKLDKTIVKSCLEMMTKNGTIQKKKTGYEFVTNDLVYGCKICNKTALSQAGISKHMIDEHVTTYRLGKLSNCKIQVKELKD